MSLENETLEEEINGILDSPQEPPLLPVIDYRGEYVGQGYGKHIDFYDVVDRNRHPDIYERLRGKIIVAVRETRVRIFDTLEEVHEVFDNVETYIRLISGPPIGGDLTLEELEGGD